MLGMKHSDDGARKGGPTIRKLVGPLLALVAILALVGIVACGGSDDDQSTDSGSSTAATGGGDDITATPIDIEALPVGTDKFEESEPKQGYVFSCINNFTGSGAFESGPWFSDDLESYNLNEKIFVEGDVEWDAQFSTEVAGSDRNLTGNGLSPDPTGTFPVAESDPAYQYDRNPNTISEYELAAALPADPQLADEPSCVGGTIGVSTTGIPIFSAFDAGGRDAVAWEIQDNCDGHPQATGQYHFHSLSTCLDSGSTEPGSEQIGWALDGLGIYIERDAEGTMLSTADLDECHGRTSTVEWDGEQVEMYHYVATLDFPYLVACYQGTAITEAEGIALGAPDGGGAPSEGGGPADGGAPPDGATPPDGAGPPE